MHTRRRQKNKKKERQNPDDELAYNKKKKSHFQTDHYNPDKFPHFLRYFDKEICVILLKIPVERFQFTRIAIVSLNVTFLGQYIVPSAPKQSSVAMIDKTIL